MNTVITATNATAPIIKTFVEPEVIKQFRKDLNVHLGSFRESIKLDIASMFDACLCVELSDAVKATPLITSVNADKFLLLVRSKYDFGSTFSLNLANAITQLNLALVAKKPVAQFANVPAEQAHLLPLYISGNSNEVDYEAIAGMCSHVSSESAMNCLVFVYGLRVEHAKKIFSTFNEI